MTVQEFLKKSIDRMKKAGIDTARLDCLVLLEDATGQDRAHLLAHPEISIQGATLERIANQVERRAGHEPLAYIRGKTEFYGREFIISKHVLEPRPESETMIELLFDLAKSKKQKAKNLIVVDVGTGSGALAITTKLEFPDAKVIATDIDPNCLKVARQNAKKLGAKIEFYQGNLLEPLLHSQPGFTYVEPGDVFSLSSEIKRMDDTLHEQRKGKIFTGPQANSRVASSARKQAVGDTWILLANLPYVPDDFKLNQAAKNEPKHAIFGGSDGLDYYREMFAQIKISINKPMYVFTESLPFQHPALAKIAQNHGHKQYQEEDFIQCFARL